MLVVTPVIILLATNVATQDYLIPFALGQQSAGPAGSVNKTGTTLSVAPLIVINSPTNGSQIPVGKFLVSGNASESAAANIQKIEVRIDDGEYKPSTPRIPSNWSSWSTTLDTAAPGPHTLKARAYYGTGEQTWSIGNVFVNAVSNAQGISNATSTPQMSGGNLSQQSLVEVSNASANKNQISENLPQHPPTQREVQPGSTDNQEAQNATDYRSPVNIPLGQG
ncbi:MAG: Ig-like domain-containing protein [Nitrososphaeraceae archaeon]